VHHGLEVFETSGRGFGLRTSKGVAIKRNEIICTYAGEIITSKEARKRDSEYEKTAAKGSYMLDADEKGNYCIDATKFRSVAALINHSCSESNCELYRALSNHLDMNFPQLQLRAKEDIGELTELTFNYVRGKEDSGEKPFGYCSECQGDHCLCRQCCIKAHKNLNL
jgi:SET domain-containing protein